MPKSKGTYGRKRGRPVKIRKTSDKTHSQKAIKLKKYKYK